MWRVWRQAISFAARRERHSPTICASIRLLRDGLWREASAQDRRRRSRTLRRRNPRCRARAAAIADRPPRAVRGRGRSRTTARPARVRCRPASFRMRRTISRPSAPPSKASFGSARHSRGRAAMPSRIDIGRIGNDQVVALSAERPEQVAPMQPDAVFKTIIGDVARGDLERVLRNIHRVDPRIRKLPRGEDRQTARAGAEVEHAFDALRDRRSAKPPSSSLAAEVRIQQFADEGARHDHALVDIERQAAHVDLVDEIGGRLSRGDAAARSGREFVLASARGDARGGESLELVGMKMQAFRRPETRPRPRDRWCRGRTPVSPR